MKTILYNPVIYTCACSCIASVLLMISTLIPTKAYAEDKVMSNFTKTLSTVYSASRSCENTIAPGPQEYIYLIANYLIKLYPNGVNYWVIPKTIQNISDPVTCIRLIQSKLMEYKNASLDYHQNYPYRSPPPILVAYQWENTYFESKPQEPPTRSYTPSSKPPAKPPVIKDKFYSNQPSLQ